MTRPLKKPLQRKLRVYPDYSIFSELFPPMQPKKWCNKQRVLVFCSRGVTYRYVATSNVNLSMYSLLSLSEQGI